MDDRRADNAVLLQYVKSIDERTGRIETAITGALKDHQEKDEIKHDEFEKRISSVEKFRMVATLLGISALGGGGAAKMGALDKIISMFTGGAQ